MIIVIIVCILLWMIAVGHLQIFQKISLSRITFLGFYLKLNKYLNATTLDEFPIFKVMFYYYCVGWFEFLMIDKLLSGLIDRLILVLVLSNMIIFFQSLGIGIDIGIGIEVVCSWTFEFCSIVLVFFLLMDTNKKNFMNNFQK